MRFKAAIIGSDKNDKITVLPGDTVDGGLGDDIITGAIGATMRGGAGIDTLIFSAKGSLDPISLKIGQQLEHDVTVLPQTVISGFEGFNFRFGESSDTLDGRGATFGVQTAMHDVFFGGSGKDTVYIDHMTSGEVSFSEFEVLKADFSQLDSAVDWNGVRLVFKGFDAFLSPQTMYIKGGNGNDEFENIALAGVVQIRGGGGNDAMGWSSNGDEASSYKGDLYDGGSGNDAISGHFGATMRGGSGIDALGLSLEIKNNVYFNVLSQLSEEITLAGGTKISGFEHLSVGFGSGNDTLDARGMKFTTLYYRGSSKINSFSSFEGGRGTDTLVVDSHTSGSFEIHGFERLKADFSDIKSPIIMLNSFIDFNGLSLFYWKVDSMIISGGSGDDSFVGGFGDDIFKGGAGADTMDGGKGNDTYIIDADDIIFEESGYGIDTVKISISYELLENFDNLILLGSKAINGTGNDLVNNIQGNSGNNIIDGKLGADILSGQLGDDVLIGGAGADKLYGDAGNDTASYATATRGVIANLANPSSNNNDAKGDIYFSIENLAGTSYADFLTGNGGSNRLHGGAGNDTLVGGLGRDIFVFETALGQKNIDTIDDFSATDDTIWLDNDVFIKVGKAGDLSSKAFHIGAAAHDADDRIIYDSKLGKLWYDADGTGSLKAVQFAVVDAGLKLTAADFDIIA